MIQKETNNAWTISCITCPAGTYPGEGWECKKCNGYGREYKQTAAGWLCGCKTGFKEEGQSCIADADFNDLVANSQVSQAKVVQFTEVISTNGELVQIGNVKSDVFNNHFAAAAAGCWKHNDRKSCQVLANLCVLTLYDMNHESCRFYNDLAEKSQNGIPYITYTESATNLIKTSLKNKGLSLTVGFYDDTASKRSQYLNF